MYLFNFIREEYGIFSFADTMLGDSIEKASKELSTYYDDVEEKLNGIIPSIKGKLNPFDDRYSWYESIELLGNPVYSFEIRANFHYFPYTTVSNLLGMEERILDHGYMEKVGKTQWVEKDATIMVMERKTHLRNLLYDYHSYIGLSDRDYAIIGIKVSLPKNNLRNEPAESVLGTYKGINDLTRRLEQAMKHIRKESKDGKKWLFF